MFLKYKTPQMYVVNQVVVCVVLMYRRIMTGWGGGKIPTTEVFSRNVNTCSSPSSCLQSSSKTISKRLDLTHYLPSISSWELETLPMQRLSAMEAFAEM
jgi:hypothetical protein